MSAIPLDLLSSTERKAVQVLKQHALVTVDDKDLGVIHSLTQLAVRGQADKGDRRGVLGHEYVITSLLENAVS